MTNKNALTLAMLLSAMYASTMTFAYATDPLPSWNDGKSKSAIIHFVEGVTTKNSPDFVPIPERIATFDNDGTLWVEQPMYVQLAFAIAKAKAIAPTRPQQSNKQPLRAIIASNISMALQGGEKALNELTAIAHGGTCDEFTASVKQWLATARDTKFNRLHTETVYQPMLELLAYLREKNFKTYIVTGGGIEFVRAFSEKIYGIPPEQVIGSSIKTKLEYRDGKPVVVRLPELDFIDDKSGKPVAIEKFIGRRPIAAFGNSDGDLQMLKWTDAGTSAHFCLFVHHTDDGREYAYDRKAKVGKLDLGLDEAAKRNWTVVDMKNDWKSIFPVITK